MVPGDEGAKPEGSRARVLVVDDEVMIGRAIHRALRNLHDVKWVGSALDAMAELRAYLVDERRKLVASGQ